MFLKYLKIVSTFFSASDQPDTFDLEAKAIYLIRKTIRTEILYIGFKLLMGLIFTSIIIFSSIQIAYALQINLSRFENGNLIEILSFSAVTLLCILTMYFLFKKDLQAREQSHHKNISASIDIETIGLKFIEGFITGLSSHNQKNNE